MVPAARTYLASYIGGQTVKVNCTMMTNDRNPTPRDADQFIRGADVRSAHADQQS